MQDLTPLGTQLGVPLRASGGMSGSISGALDALQAQSQVDLEDWRLMDFQGERIGVAFQGAALTTNPRANLTVLLDGIEGGALPASSARLAGRYGDGAGQVEFAVTDGPYRETRLAGHIDSCGRIRKSDSTPCGCNIAAGAGRIPARSAWSARPTGRF